ncbi:MAG: hypothetical protein ABSC10_06500 [Candidatus Acidiferrales bacterium]|jgi:hypothetical protein
MTEQARPKRPSPDFRFGRQCTDERRSPLVGERQILELIALGAPLPGILNKLCTILDVRIGNVVSIVSLPGAGENYNCSMTRSAQQVGLEVFSSSAIVGSDRSILGTLEVYGCDPRRPTMLETQLINRVAYLASLALQRPEPEGDFARPCVKARSKLGGLVEKPPLIN